MSISIKEAMTEHYTKLENLYMKDVGTKPSVSYTDQLNKALLISEPDEDMEVEWQLIAQPAHDWTQIEEKLGFSLMKELKEYYNTFYFMDLSGTFGSSELHFYMIDGSKPLDDVVTLNYTDAQHVFPNSQMFLIGTASVNNDDNYFIFFDNNTGKLFCYDSEMNKQILLSYSIAKTISSLKAVY